jgi:hypothetical protein
MNGTHQSALSLAGLADRRVVLPYVY